MSGAKTEAPTPRRLRKAREEGDGGASVFASQAIGLVGAIAVFPATLAAGAFVVEERLREAIRTVSRQGAFPSFDGAAMARDVVLLSVPILAIAATVSAAASLIQGGGRLGLKRLSPRLERLDPIAGLSQLLTRARLFAVVRALGAGLLVAWLVARELRGAALAIVRTSGRLDLVRPIAMTLGKTLAWECAAAGLAFAALDIVVVRTDWWRRLRMSRDEVEREKRETAGDPRAKEARDEARQELVLRGTVGDVRRAAVVVHAGSAFACALAYADGDRAPRVVASGGGPIALAIVQAGLDHTVPVVDSAEVARALVALPAGEEIPENLYEPIAALLRDAGYPNRQA